MAEAAGDDRSTGTVKWFSAQKGYGFIAPDDGGEDIFVHQTSIRAQGFRTLSENQPVEFSVDFGEEGRAKAVDVVAIRRFRRSFRGGRAEGRGGSYSRRGGRDGYSRGGYGNGGGGGGGGGLGGECYNCGRMGHLARDCYQSRGGGGGGRARGHGGGARTYGRGARGGGDGCYRCGEGGHFARECPNQ